MSTEAMFLYSWFQDYQSFSSLLPWPKVSTVYASTNEYLDNQAQKPLSLRESA